MSLDFSKLECVKALADRTIAACPACREQGHDKKGDHLVIWPDGKFGCVSNPDDSAHRSRIFALAGAKDEKPSPARTPARRRSSWPTIEAAAAAITPPGFHLEAVYRYGNAAAVARYEPDEGGEKTFRQFSVDGSAWVTGAPPGKWPLFGPIPTAKDAPIILVTEGEKACLAARSIGLPCVCSSGGSSAATKSDWSPLAGRKVAILPDNDAPGRKYADAVATILAALNPPATARRVILPDLPERGDVADYIDARRDLGDDPQAIAADVTEMARDAFATRKHHAAESAPKPILILPSASVSITECAENLFAIIAAKRDMFMRGGVIQELTRDDKGVLGLSVVRPDAFRSRIEGYAILKKHVAVKDGFALKGAICPDETAKALMASLPADRLLPRIRGIASSPVASKGQNGELRVLNKGFHDASGGILVTGGGEVVDIPIQEAVAFLKGMLDEFAFNTPSDRARALAMMITPALRIGGWLGGHCPIFVIEADKSQTGKGYMLNLLSCLYGEHPYILTQKDGGVGSFDESISAALLAGRPFIQLDNLRGKLSSAFLEMVITAGGLVQCRVPHRGEVSVDSTYFTFTLTSNGIETTQDLANRSCIVRIRKRDGYRFRDYPEGDLLSHVKANQMLYLSSVFSVVKEWAALGCGRNRDECRHDFREWAQSLDFIMRNILQEPPLLDGHDDAKITVSNPALVWLRAVAIAAEQSGRLDEEFTASSLAELSADAEIEIPACRSDSDEDRRKRVGVLLHRLIPAQNGEVIFDVFRVQRLTSEKYDFDRSRTVEVKNYRIFKNVGIATFSTTAQQLSQPVKDPEKVGIFQEVYGVGTVGAENQENVPENDQLFDEF